MWETWVWSLGREDPLEKARAIHSSILCLENSMDRAAWRAKVHEECRAGQDWALTLSLFPLYVTAVKLYEASAVDSKGNASFGERVRLLPRLRKLAWGSPCSPGLWVASDTARATLEQSEFTWRESRLLRGRAFCSWVCCTLSTRMCAPVCKKHNNKSSGVSSISKQSYSDYLSFLKK